MKLEEPTMPNVWISRETQALVRRCEQFRSPTRLNPDGSAYIEISDETLERLEYIMLLGEDYNGVIQRLCRLYLGMKLQ